MTRIVTDAVIYGESDYAKDFNAGRDAKRQTPTSGPSRQLPISVKWESAALDGALR